MNLLYLGYFCTDETFMKILNNGINNMSFARQRYEKKLLVEIVKAEDVFEGVTIASYIPVSDKISLDTSNETIENTKINIFALKKSSMGSILKQLIRFNKFLKVWLKENDSPVIMCYSINPIFVIPALLHRKKHKYRVLEICSELPQFRVFKKGMLSRIRRKILVGLLKKFDAYILFAKPMHNYIPMGRPYAVLEGFADKLERNDDVADRIKAVMYAGGLAKYHGINNLLDAFISIDDPTIELWICGNGTEKDAVIAAAQKDTRIKYHGVLPNEKVLELERKCSILINPADNKDELSNYAFPSKILEYMSSGTPIITTHLEGIPEEYYEFLYPIADNSTDRIREELIRVFSIRKEILDERGKAAASFVKNNKIPEKQVIKVLDFIKNL